MVNIDELKNNIGQLNWTSNEKTVLLSMLPKFSRYMLDFVDTRIFSLGSKFESTYILDSLSNMLVIQEDLKKGNTATFLNLLKKSLNEPRYDFGRYVLSFALEVKELMAYNKLPYNEVVKESINNFEIKLFYEVPGHELENIVKSDLLFFLKKINLLMEFKRFYLNRNVFTKGALTNIYIKNLENNDETLGSGSITINEKNEPTTVKNWLKDYVVSVPKAVSSRTTYDEIQYLKTSPNVAKLSLTDKDTLLEILKLYMWFLKPSVNPKEVEEYEKEIREIAVEESDDINEIIPQPQAEKNILPPKMAVPQPKVQDILYNKQVGILQETKKQSAVSNFEKPAPANINAQDIIKQREQKRQQEQLHIDKKLAALKERIK